MEKPLCPREPGPYWKRERDVFDLYAAFQDIPQIDNLGPDPNTSSFPPDFVPKPTPDASLAAFAQLAAIRLCAQRSMISLIDGQYQYILAEATPQTPLRANLSPKSSDILLGNVKIPRNWGLCEQVLDPGALANGDPGIIIIKDLSQSRQHECRSYVLGEPHFKFYAGVPIRSLNGTVVGSMCIFDGPERSGMVQEDILYLQDLAATVMEYLVTYTLKDQHRRGAEGLHGLLTFAEADTKLKSVHDQSHSPQLITKELHRTHENGHSGRMGEDAPPQKNDDFLSESARTSTAKELPERRPSMSDLQGSVIPNAMRELFARAAEIMRRSNDMDGVVFLDASVAATSIDGGDPSPSRVSGKLCQILGFAMHETSSYEDNHMPKNMILTESNLSWLLKQYPQGYSLDCNEEQAIPLTDQDVLPVGALSIDTAITIPSQPPTLTALSMHISTLKVLFPDIKSALFLPLWCFDRQRWLSGCFCWSTRAERNLSGPRDLPFIKAFGNSIMQEVARLDAMETNQAKTTFLSSLSHELRSPLHGILGSIQLMRSTSLDSFQAAMVNAITVCGRTLLGTVQHLLDHAGRKDPSHNYSLKTFPREHTICITADAPTTDFTRSLSTAKLYCNVGLITEEVVETMFLGQARYDVSLGGEEIPGRPVDRSSSWTIARRRNRFIIEDIVDYANLDLLIPSSSYGRIVMNLLGNALKFTESGYILLSVRSERAEGSKVPLTLRISDSGIGISRDFLCNDMFEPFRKENQHSAGTGVGLSVVKRIIEDIGGSIEVSSEVDKGTDITVKLLLERYKRPEESDSSHGAIAAALSQLKDRKICLLHSKLLDVDATPEHSREWQTLKRYIDALVTTLEVELKMVVNLTSEWNGQDESDIVICPEVSFESLQKIRDITYRKPPATLFIAMDTMEADTLRCDARVTSPASVVEIVTQPCGPYKLGMVLSQCLSRYDKTDEVMSDDMGPTLEHHLTANVNGSQLVSELGPRLGLYPSLPYRSRSEESQISKRSTLENRTLPREPVASNPKDIHIPENPPVLIVDDNAINRRLLAAFLKKQNFAYQEAKDGLQALEKYKEAEGKFSVILMDISMPVMDGMTSTRLIREHEKITHLTSTHIIALTGLTSASAKLEAWTSGVDDFLTKPVDFGKLQSLMKAGRGGEGTGFLSDQGEKGGVRDLLG